VLNDSKNVVVGLSTYIAPILAALMGIVFGYYYHKTLGLPESYSTAVVGVTSRSLSDGSSKRGNGGGGGGGVYSVLLDNLIVIPCAFFLVVGSFMLSVVDMECSSNLPNYSTEDLVTYGAVVVGLFSFIFLVYVISVSCCYCFAQNNSDDDGGDYKTVFFYARRLKYLFGCVLLLLPTLCNNWLPQLWPYQGIVTVGCSFVAFLLFYAYISLLKLNNDPNKIDGLWGQTELRIYICYTFLVYAFIVLSNWLFVVLVTQKILISLLFLFVTVIFAFLAVNKLKGTEQIESIL
jgi:hypothetical protein